jgi:hypothetical protein
MHEWGSSITNGSNLDKNNIIKPTFDALIEEGRKGFEAYRADLDQLFLSHYEVMRQGGHPQGHCANHHSQGGGNT